MGRTFQTLNISHYTPLYPIISYIIHKISLHISYNIQRSKHFHEYTVSIDLHRNLQIIHRLSIKISIHEDIFPYVCMYIYILCMDLNWRHMDMYWIRIGYQWISVQDIYEYHLDMVWICLGYILRLRPGPASVRAGRRVPGSSASGMELGRPGRCHWASQSASHCSSSPGHSDWAGYDASVPGGFIDDACAWRAGFRNITIITCLPVLIVPVNAC